MSTILVTPTAQMIEIPGASRFSVYSEVNENNQAPLNFQYSLIPVKNVNEGVSPQYQMSSQGQLIGETNESSILFLRSQEPTHVNVQHTPLSNMFDTFIQYYPYIAVVVLVGILGYYGYKYVRNKRSTQKTQRSYYESSNTVQEPPVPSSTQAIPVSRFISGTVNTSGMNTGGINTGGMNTGGINTGGMNTGGINTGGTGGINTGGTGGMNTGGTGGMNTGGTGGMNTGGTGGMSGMNTGGMNTGGTGGMNTGGMNTGGMNTGGTGGTGAMNTGGNSTFSSTTPVTNVLAPTVAQGLPELPNNISFDKKDTRSILDRLASFSD